MDTVSCIALFALLFVWAYVLLNFQNIKEKFFPSKIYSNYDDIPKKQYEKDIVFKNGLSKKSFLLLQHIKKKMGLYFWVQDGNDPNHYQMRKLI